jgi:hypothetical protein
MRLPSAARRFFGDVFDDKPSYVFSEMLSITCSIMSSNEGG